MGGRLFGAKEYDGLWSLAKKINTYGFIVSIFLLLLGLVFYQSVGSIFSKDSSVLATFNSIFYIVLLGLPINAVAFLFDGMFKGMGKMKLLRNVLLVATFLGFVPTLYLGLYFNLGIHAIWIAFTVWMLMRSFPLVWKFRATFKPLLQKP